MRATQIFLNDSQYARFKPAEDFVLVKNNIFVVADGITRDPFRPANFTGKNTRQLLKCYPRPSPAKIAAEQFCYQFVAYLIEKREVKLKDVRSAMVAGNRHLTLLNKKNNPTLDYLVNDFWGCVAAGGVIQDYKLYWSAIGDCGVAIVGIDNKIKFITPDWVQLRQALRTKLLPCGFDWRLAKYRQLVRKKFRNNPCLKVGGQVISYGVLTGERAAEKFIYSGKIDLTKGDRVIFYTDGAAPLVRRPDFIRFLGNKSQIKKIAASLARRNYEFGHERTMVIVAV